MTAATGRKDYDHTVTLSTLEPGEPIFVIRGRDAVGADAVRAWANLAGKSGAPVEAVELALKQADRLAAWPAKKNPDGPDLSDHERKQLRYEHSRRAWNARERISGESEILAHQLGQDAVRGVLRPLLADLEREIAGHGDIVPTLRTLLAMANRTLPEGCLCGSLFYETENRAAYALGDGDELINQSELR